MKKTALLMSALLVSGAALAKLPALSEEAKAKAAEAAAKTAHGNKVADYQLCLSREKVAAHYFKTTGKGKAAATQATPSCDDPGAFKAPAAITAQGMTPAGTGGAPAAVKPGTGPEKPTGKKG